MTAGVGCDITEIRRLQEALDRNGEAFLNRVLVPEELQEYHARKDALTYLAGRWAGKEAVAKMLGTGFGAGCAMNDITILTLPSGAPSVRLSGAAGKTAEKLGIRTIHLSLSHDGGFALAFAVGENS